MFFMICRMLGLLLLGLSTSCLGYTGWHDEEGGATREFYNSKYRLQWGHPLGDWLDAGGVLNGDKPYISLPLTTSHAGSYVELDVTNMLRSTSGDGENVDFFFKSKGDFKFSSRESEQFSPSIELYIADHLRQFFSIRDTQLDISTNKNLGNSGSVKVGRRSNGLVGFSIPEVLVNAPELKKIILRLHIAKIYGRGATLHVYRVAAGTGVSARVDSASTHTAIAEAYPGDLGIGSDNRVLFFDDFDGPKKIELWGKRSQRIEAQARFDESAVDSEDSHLTSGKALEVTIKKGNNRGMNRRYKFKDNGFDEPEEAYFRYYLRLSNDWNSDLSGGKLPGFAGTYGRSGWGGRKTSASGGWSARGFFFLTSEDESGIPLTPLGNYVYHLDQVNRYGSDWIWSQNGGALLKNNRWYSIEQHVKLNSPGKSDGILRGWLDGRLVFEKIDLRFRGDTALKIEEIWFNVYHGGGDSAPRDLVLYLDNVVIARDYIGPIHSNGPQ